MSLKHTFQPSFLSTLWITPTTWEPPVTLPLDPMSSYLLLGTSLGKSYFCGTILTYGLNLLLGWTRNSAFLNSSNYSFGPLKLNLFTNLGTILWNLYLLPHWKNIYTQPSDPMLQLLWDQNLILTKFNHSYYKLYRRSLSEDEALLVIWTVP